MKITTMAIAAALMAAPVYAQEMTASPPAPARAADQALEITIGAGYAQGFGDIGAGQRNLTDQSSAGGELQLGVGYRINPNFMVGVYGSRGLQDTGTITSCPRRRGIPGSVSAPDGARSGSPRPAMVVPIRVTAWTSRASPRASITA